MYDFTRESLNHTKITWRIIINKDAWAPHLHVSEPFPPKKGRNLVLFFQLLNFTSVCTSSNLIRFILLLLRRHHPHFQF